MVAALFVAALGFTVGVAAVAYALLARASKTVDRLLGDINQPRKETP